MVGRLLKYWLPVIVWMMVVFSASTSLGSPRHTSRFLRPFLLWLNPHISERTIETIHYCVRKTAHLGEYAVLGLLVWRLVHFERGFGAAGLAGELRLALLLCVLYAASDEFHQLFVAEREAAVRDVIIDSLGAACGMLVFWLRLRLRRTDVQLQIPSIAGAGE